MNERQFTIVTLLLLAVVIAALIIASYRGYGPRRPCPSLSDEQCVDDARRLDDPGTHSR